MANEVALNRNYRIPLLLYRARNLYIVDIIMHIYVCVYCVHVINKTKDLMKIPSHSVVFTYANMLRKYICVCLFHYHCYKYVYYYYYWMMEDVGKLTAKSQPQ